MKLLQLNIWEGRLNRQIIPFIKEQKPDILCLQEVFSCKGYIEVPTGTFSSFENIVKATGHRYSYFSPTVKMNVDNRVVSYGNGFISAYPIIDIRTHFTHNPLPSDEKYKTNKGVLQLAKVVGGEGKTFTILNHHGYWEGNQMGSEISIACMQKVHDIAMQLDGPVIISGDLNVSAQSPAMAVFGKAFRNLTAEHDIKSTLTVLGKVDNVACDHIFISKGIKVRRFTVSEALVSDHKPLLLEFNI